MKLNKVDYLIIHHSATPRDKTTFEAVRRYHIQKGWGDIGYHFFITADGTIHKGRKEEDVGAHCRASGMNFKSLGICLAGNFTKEYPSAKQLKSLSSLLNQLTVKYLILPDHILGHCEVPGARTLCPGENLLEWVHIYKATLPKKKLLYIKLIRILKRLIETLKLIKKLKK